MTIFSVFKFNATKHLTPSVHSYPHTIFRFSCFSQPSPSASVYVRDWVSLSPSLAKPKRIHSVVLRDIQFHIDRDLYFMGLNCRDLVRILALLKLFHQWPIHSLLVSPPSSSLFWFLTEFYPLPAFTFSSSFFTPSYKSRLPVFPVSTSSSFSFSLLAYRENKTRRKYYFVPGLFWSKGKLVAPHQVGWSLKVGKWKEVKLSNIWILWKVINFIDRTYWIEVIFLI